MPISLHREEPNLHVLFMPLPDFPINNLKKTGNNICVFRWCCQTTIIMELFLFERLFNVDVDIIWLLITHRARQHCCYHCNGKESSDESIMCLILKNIFKTFKAIVSKKLYMTYEQNAAMARNKVYNSRFRTLTTPTQGSFQTCKNKIQLEKKYIKKEYKNYTRQIPVN